MTTQTISIKPLVPCEDQQEEEEDFFNDARSGVSIGDIEADYDKDGGGNEPAAEEGVNDIDFDD
jgi:hypothetical protein